MTLSQGESRVALSATDTSVRPSGVLDIDRVTSAVRESWLLLSVWWLVVDMEALPETPSALSTRPSTRSLTLATGGGLLSASIQWFSGPCSSWRHMGQVFSWLERRGLLEQWRLKHSHTEVWKRSRDAETDDGSFGPSRSSQICADPRQSARLIDGRVTGVLTWTYSDSIEQSHSSSYFITMRWARRRAAECKVTISVSKGYLLPFLATNEIINTITI